ncbi:N-acetyl-gamma-glutamyl-phosphate reductase [Pseudidiomarina sp.]|uniref:N-acetyl-gamma-glutamyl-phosphate reductase n=1 Tax=Pseudidiomarina sp. TaxID=2081707 RepID=UPI00299E5F67|nr:N-acetyl-gamma-glutamyl-phosphate reductase [Pseudidiomarina sp.]MDX1706034.1 N-acetyl-gamma-glutamyl-phosphate reductase [Pseudidiomarina sp.]
MQASPTTSKIPCAIFGASGYSGVELIWLLHNHPDFDVRYGFSSGARRAEPVSQLYPQLTDRIDLTLQPWHPDLLGEVAEQVQVCFLALPHEASAELAPKLTAAGLIVFDLSGAFRLRDETVHKSAYGFSRPQPDQSIPYGLAEWTTLAGTEALIAVPGCYPTAAALALLPVLPFITDACTPIVNAVSGVSGAGRKAAAHTSFCEVSLQAYGVGTHRHQPEIAQAIGRPVLFVPHLANFRRGILATIYVEVAGEITSAQIDDAFNEAYAQWPLVRLRAAPPAISDVAGTPFCDIHWQLHGRQLVLCVAIDNLLKGAAGQAVQLANQYFGLAPAAGLTKTGGVL